MGTEPSTNATLGPLPLRPRLDEKPWGGRSLAQFGFELPPDSPIGEALVTAAEAVVDAGPHAGASLGDLAAADPLAVCGERGLVATGGRTVFPLLIKLIDAAENLSIQVHPNDAAAAERGPEALGKTEAWFVLAATPGATIYAGLGQGHTFDALAERVRAAKGGTAALMRHLTAQPGLTLLLPAGTVHALGAGIVVYEVQQPSDITYRLDDWGRVDSAGRPREMHIEPGLAAVDPTLRPEPIAPVELPTPAGRRQLITACRYFATERLALPTGASLTFSDPATPHVLTCLSGSATVTAAGQTQILPAGRSLVLPAAASPASLQATAPAIILRSWVPDLLTDIVTPARQAGTPDDRIAALGGPTPDIVSAL